LTMHLKPGTAQIEARLLFSVFTPALQNGCNIKIRILFYLRSLGKGKYVNEI
jgi:hypothetical protein